MTEPKPIAHVTFLCDLNLGLIFLSLKSWEYALPCNCMLEALSESWFNDSKLVHLQILTVNIDNKLTVFYLTTNRTLALCLNIKYKKALPRPLLISGLSSE